MPRPALAITALRGTLPAPAPGERRLLLRVEGGLLQISEEGLRLLLPPGAPILLDRLENGRVWLRGSFKGLTAAIELRPHVGERGVVSLEVVSVRAGFLPIPGPLVGAFLPFLREQLEGKRGLHLSDGNRVDLDLAEILEPLGIFLPPLRAVRAAPGGVELEF